MQTTVKVERDISATTLYPFFPLASSNSQMVQLQRYSLAFEQAHLIDIRCLLYSRETWMSNELI